MAQAQQERFGRYELLSRIGRGGMAETWRARLVGAAGVTKPVLIKKVLPEYANDEGFISMFISEARISATLSHGNIAQVYDFGEVDGEYFLAMEFVHGQPLNRVLKRALRSGFSCLPVPLATFIALEMCRGLHYAHTRTDDDGAPLGIVHRDISPDNVLISFEGQVKIVDFGIAKARSLRTFNTAPGVVKGKYLYFSPEQARGHEVDARSDVWATGVVLYQLVCGQRPWEGQEYLVMPRLLAGHFPRPRELRPDLPVELESILLRALALDRDERFESCHAFGDALAGFLHTTAPRFSTMNLAYLLRVLYREDLAAGGRDTKVPPAFEEELSVWRTAQPPAPRPERASTDSEVASVHLDASEDAVIRASLQSAVLEREPSRVPWRMVGGGLLLVAALFVASVWTGTREQLQDGLGGGASPHPDLPPAAAAPQPLKPFVPPQPVPPAEPDANATRKATNDKKPPGVATWPVTSVRLEADRDVMGVSSGMAGLVDLTPGTRYRLAEIAGTRQDARRPNPPLFYRVSGREVPEEGSEGPVSRKPVIIQGGSAVLLFTLGPRIEREDLPERNVEVRNLRTGALKRVTVHPESMTATDARAFTLEGLDPMGVFKLRLEPVGEGAFLRGPGQGEARQVGCVELAPATGRLQRFLVRRGQEVRVSGVRGLRCGFIDDDPSDNQGAMELRVERMGGDVRVKDVKALINAERYDEAAALAEACVQRTPESAECQLLLGTVSARLGQVEKGARAYRHFLELAPASHPMRATVQRLVDDYTASGR